MADDWCDRLAETFDCVEAQLRGATTKQQAEVIREWFDREVSGGIKQRNFAFRLICASAAKSNSSITINTGALIVDKRTRVDTGGGDIVGAAIGAGAKVDAELIQNFKGNVDSSANIEAGAKQLLKDAIDEIAKQPWTEEEKAELLADVEKLSAQIGTQTPSEHIAKKVWNGIWSVGKALPSVIELGKWLVAKYPWISP